MILPVLKLAPRAIDISSTYVRWNALILKDDYMTENVPYT